MNKVLEVFNEYTRSRKKMFELFGTEGWENIEDQIATRWYKDERESGLEFLNESGEEYSFESADKIGDTIDGMELFYIRENGEVFYALFSENLNYADYDDYENQMNVKI